jgi:hypothetical protein
MFPRIGEGRQLIMYAAARAASPTFVQDKKKKEAWLERYLGCGDVFFRPYHFVEKFLGKKTQKRYPDQREN